MTTGLLSMNQVVIDLLHVREKNGAGGKSDKLLTVNQEQ